MKASIRSVSFRLISRLLREESGSSFIILAFSITLVTALLGASIDYGHAQLAQSKLSHAVDAAGLAVGAGGVNNAEESVGHPIFSKYLTANFPGGFLGTDAENMVTTYTKLTSPTRVRVTAQTRVPTPFMGLFGYHYANVSASATIAFKGGLEVVMVLDNTGSMADGSPAKIDKLKLAAKGLVQVLHGGSMASAAGTDTNPNLWIGMVPFTQGVNIGNGRSSWLTGGDNCVYARQNNPGSLNVIQPINYSSLATLDTSIINDTDVDDTTPGTLQFTGSNNGCPTALTPMTASQNDLIKANGPIAQMSTYTSTEIDLGVAWGLRMLSPSWRQAWDSTSTTMNTDLLPKDYGTDGLTKAIVVLTDGDNTINSDAAYGNYTSGNIGAMKVYTTKDVTMQMGPPWQSKIVTTITTLAGTATITYTRTCKSGQTFAGGCTGNSGKYTETVSSASYSLTPTSATALTTGTLSGDPVACSGAPNQNQDCTSSTRSVATTYLPTAESDTTYGAGVSGRPPGYWRITSGNLAQAQVSLHFPGTFPNQRQQIDAKTLQACRNAKAHGILVYTIGLGVDGTSLSPDALAVLRECATAPNFFFDQPTQANLETTFKAVGDSLNALRVTE